MKKGEVMKNYIKVLVAAATLSVAVTACNKKDSGNNTAQTGQFYNNGWGTGGVNGGSAIGTGFQFQTSNGVLTGTADILGDGSQINQFNGGNCIGQPFPQQYPNQYPQPYPCNGGYPNTNYGQNILYTYSGQASIVGQMNISQNVQAGNNYYYGGGINNGYNNCMIPAGTYTIQTQQPGFYQQGILQNFRIMASGPAQLEITMSGTVTLNGTPRIGMNASIDRINGQSCGSVPFSTF